MPRRVITLTTDFGLRDPYVAEMKAVILGIYSEATIVDISHEVEKYNIGMAAFILASAAPYFPADSIHVAVVDPGVGTKRKAIIVQKGDTFFTGPDNGVLSLAIDETEETMHVREIENKKLILPNISNTFHGRDVFAPVAGYLAIGIPLEEFGPEISNLVRPRFSSVTERNGKIVGEIAYVDGFGNVITNIKEHKLSNVKKGMAVNVKLGNTSMNLKFCGAYDEVANGSLLALIGSHDFLEISQNRGNAAKVLKIRTGEKVIVTQSR